MAKFNKISTIIFHEYLTKLKSKGFIIGTLLGPIILLALIAVPVATTMMSMDEAGKRLAIVDYSDGIGKSISTIDTSRYYLTLENEETLREMTLMEEIDGYLLIPEDIIQEGKAQVFTRGGGGIGYISKLERNLSHILRQERLIESGADSNVINLVNKGVEISTQKITSEGTEKDYTEELAGLGYLLGFAIYMLMFIYGGMVSRSVIEEKANRIIEVIASSVKPFEILFGKVVGVGLLGLTQVIFWVIMAAILLTAAGYIMGSMGGVDPAALTEGMPQVSDPNMPSGFDIPSISPWLAVGFVFYFISGYFIYSTLFAAVGSAVDQEQDAAQIQIPVMLPIILPILLIGNVMANPDSTFATVVSLIPFFSPILMMVRVAATDVPLWQIGASVVLMALTFLGCLWIAARIYKVGIFMTGKKPTFKDLGRWIKLAK